MQVHLSLKSANVKTGPIPVSTTEKASCPADCAMRGECYAASGPLALHWNAVSQGTRGTAWGEFCEAIAALPEGQLWRHNQAGDLPQIDGSIDAVKLGQLVAANQGKRGFTYSHHRDRASLAWIRHANVKTGPIPVSTTEKASCPADCAMRGECYAASGPLALHWNAVSQGTRGTAWGEFCEAIAALPEGQLWRHNQAGDLPQIDGSIDAVKLGQLVAANQGKRGFTYSHHRDRASLAWIRHANDWGFTVNLSANDLSDADTLAETGAGPVVVVLPSTQSENCETPAGRKVVVCPATQRDDVSCATCQLCQRQRSTIVGFPAHGSRHRVINLRLAK